MNAPTIGNIELTGFYGRQFLFLGILFLKETWLNIIGNNDIVMG
jgi:hypothetical protein